MEKNNQDFYISFFSPDLIHGALGSRGYFVNASRNEVTLVSKEYDWIASSSNRSLNTMPGTCNRMRSYVVQQEEGRLVVANIMPYSIDKRGGVAASVIIKLPEKKIGDIGKILTVLDNITGRFEDAILTDDGKPYRSSAQAQISSVCQSIIEGELPNLNALVLNDCPQNSRLNNPAGKPRDYGSIGVLNLPDRQITASEYNTAMKTIVAVEAERFLTSANLQPFAILNPYIRNDEISHRINFPEKKPELVSEAAPVANPASLTRAFGENNAGKNEKPEKSEEIANHLKDALSGIQGLLQIARAGGPAADDARSAIIELAAFIKPSSPRPADEPALKH